MLTKREWNLIGIGYTLATGKNWTVFSEFHKVMEELTIFTHEFGSQETWSGV